MCTCGITAPQGPPWSFEKDVRVPVQAVCVWDQFNFFWRRKGFTQAEVASFSSHDDNGNCSDDKVQRDTVRIHVPANVKYIQCENKIAFPLNFRHQR